MGYGGYEAPLRLLCATAPIAIANAIARATPRHATRAMQLPRASLTGAGTIVPPVGCRGGRNRPGEERKATNTEGCGKPFPLPQTLRQQGNQRLDDTGLLFYNARYYDPMLGRFISADWIVPGAPGLTVHPFGSVAGGMWGDSADSASGGGGPANAQDLNRYSYANNNPIKNTDPTGHCSKRSRCGAQGGGGGAVKGPGRGASSPNGAMKGAQAGATRTSNLGWGNGSSEVLRSNLKEAGLNPPPFPNAAHHIVAHTDARAAPAQSHLAKLGIHADDPVNGVFLRTGPKGEGVDHRLIHTDKYYAEVNQRILAGETKNEVAIILRDIADELRLGTFPYK
jgi:RHS repeat-associated protein